MKIEVRRFNGQPRAWWKPRATDHWDKKLGAGNRLEIQLVQWSKYPIQTLQYLMPGQLRLDAAVNRLERRIRGIRSEEHTSELQSLTNLVCRLLLEKKIPVIGMAFDIYYDRYIIEYESYQECEFSERGFEPIYMVP